VKVNKLIAIAGLVLSVSLFAEEDNLETVTSAETTAAATSEAAVTTAPADSKIIGQIDIRPQWVPSTNAVNTDNTIEGGYQFDADTSLSYNQEFSTNFSNPTANAGMDLKVLDGFLRTRLKNLLVNDNLSLSYENRVYLPTAASQRDRGLITAIRNYATISQKLNDTVSLTLQEIPVLYFYSQSGFGDEANKGFENRIYLIADINLAQDVSFSLPLLYYATRYRSYATTAKYDDSWGHLLYTWPEITVRVHPNAELGFAYMSENFLTEGPAGAVNGVDIGSAFSNGTAQIVLRANL